MKNILIACFISFSLSSVGQDTARFTISNIGLEINSLVSSRRIVTTPPSVYNSDFYEEQFGDYGNKYRKIGLLTVGTQIGGKLGFSLEFIKKLPLELSIGLGYQNSSTYKDSVEKHSTRYIQSNSAYSVQEAMIKMNYNFHEFYFSTAILIKKKLKSVNLFSGIGVNYIYSKPTIKVEEHLKKDIIKRYNAEVEAKNFFHFYIPIGMEYSFSKTKNKGFMWRVNYALRVENPIYSSQSLRFFSSLDMSLIYQL